MPLYRYSVRFVFVAACLAAALASHANAQSTAITYQGQLKQSGAALNTTADFEFKLFNAVSAGTQIGSTNPVNSVNVVDGLFTVTLNFGTGAFDGSQRWLQVAVRSPAGSGNFTTLAPRQSLTATPFALYALSGPGSGGPWAVNGNSIASTNTGNVGIGIPSPSAKLDIQAINGSNVLFGRRTSGGLAHNLYIDSNGNGSMQLIDSTNTVRVEMANGLMYLNYGNVGVGTTTPTSKLHVQGDVRVSGDVLIGSGVASSGLEDLRIIRGAVDANGSITSGVGTFTVNHFATGQYLITFATSFAAPPSVSAMARAQSGAGNHFLYANLTSSQVEIRTFDGDGLADCIFTFFAIGPR